MKGQFYGLQYFLDVLFYAKTQKIERVSLKCNQVRFFQCEFVDLRIFHRKHETNSSDSF